jgi:AraC-like DNA-binding protein
MAEELGIGRNRFQKEIKDLTGLSPVELVRSVRLNEARKKLANPKLSISEVAYSVGFNNLSYFTRSFKAEFGMLPSEYRDNTST